MRHPPAFQADVATGRAWCLAWALLVGLASASLLAWCLAMTGLPLVLSLLAAWPGVWAWRQLQRRPVQSLRWDGQSWWLGPVDSRGSETRQGSLQPLLDLGDWMLLRFNERPRQRFGSGPSHLALARADLPRQWPQLRLTLYSAAGLAAQVRHPESSPTR